MSTRVLLADDHRVLREGLRALLESREDIEVVAETDNGRDAVYLARKLSPDVIVMDANMPDLNGATATRRILAQQPHIKIVALSMHSDRHYVDDMLGAGASAYLLKTCDIEELLHAIDVAGDGQSYLSPEITQVVVSGYARGAYVSDRSAGAELTDREREVLQLLAEGKTSKGIAHELHVSIKTVTTHRQHIMDKLDIRSVAELTKFAVREGLTSL